MAAKSQKGCNMHSPSKLSCAIAAVLERVEVLGGGPQGTLCGAGAQAGVIRYITLHHQ